MGQTLFALLFWLSTQMMFQAFAQSQRGGRDNPQANCKAASSADFAWSGIYIALALVVDHLHGCCNAGCWTRLPRHLFKMPS